MSMVWSFGANAALWFYVHTPVKNNLCVCHSFGLLVPSCGFPAALFPTSPAPLLPGAHAPTVHSLVFGHFGYVIKQTAYAQCATQVSGQYYRVPLHTDPFLFSLKVGGNNLSLLNILFQYGYRLGFSTNV